MSHRFLNLAQGVVMEKRNLEAKGGFGAGAMKPCQHRADVKAFTGKGRARRANVRIDVVALAAELAQIKAEMSELADASRKVPGYGFYLTTHRRPDPGQKYSQHSIRWREVATQRHMSWEEMPARFAEQLPTLAQWYRQATEHAIRLNAEESATRGALRAAERYQALAGLFADNPA